MRAELRLTKAHVTSPLATLGFFWASSIFRANRVEYRSMMPLQLSADADEFLYHSSHTKPIGHEESFNTQIMHTVSYSSLLVKCSRICISAGNVLMCLRPFVCQSITQPHIAKSEIVYHTVQCLFINQSINKPTISYHAIFVFRPNRMHNDWHNVHFLKIGICPESKTRASSEVPGHLLIASRPQEETSTFLV